MKANQEAVARRLVGSGMDVVYMNTECSSVRRPRETHHDRMQHRGALVSHRGNVFPIPPPFNPFWFCQRQLANSNPGSGSELDVATSHVGSDGGVTMQRMHKAGATLRSTCFGFRVPDECQNPDSTIKVASPWSRCVMSWRIVVADCLLGALHSQQHELVVATMWYGTSRPCCCRTTCHDFCQGSPTRTTLTPW